MSKCACDTAVRLRLHLEGRGIEPCVIHDAAEIARRDALLDADLDAWGSRRAA